MTYNAMMNMMGSPWGMQQPMMQQPMGNPLQQLNPLQMLSMYVHGQNASHPQLQQLMAQLGLSAYGGHVMSKGGEEEEMKLREGEAVQGAPEAPVEEPAGKTVDTEKVRAMLKARAEEEARILAERKAQQERTPAYTPPVVAPHRVKMPEGW